MSHPSDLSDQGLPQVADDPSRAPVPAGQCCSLQRWMVPLLSLVAIVAIVAAAYFAGRSQAAQAQANPFAAFGDLPLINADSAVTSEKYSIATGTVSDEAEGLLVLDHNSGVLQCKVLYPRSGQFLATFTTNVAADLGAGGKGGKYMMVTGGAQFLRSSSRPAGSTVIYVMDTASGNYVCYGIPFDQTAVPRNRPQQGAMVLLYSGTANPVIDRDNLR